MPMTIEFSPTQQSALDLIQLERALQHQDSLLSLSNHQNIVVAKQIAAALLESKRPLLMFGMGASHYANRVAESVYRAYGFQAFAVPLSEALYSPIPNDENVQLIVSQSGESGEAIHYLERAGLNAFGLTMNSQSTLARAVPSLIGAGGVERGFAATRSLMVTLVLHACILEALGFEQTPLREVLTKPTPIDHLSIQLALETLNSAKQLVFSGRAELQGIAEVSALHAAELARIPSLALEGGQFRHGPLELLEPGLGVVLLRAGGESAALTESLVNTCLTAGVKPILIDPSGSPEIAGAVQFRFPALQGLAAAVAVLPTLQELLLKLAAKRVEFVGQPRRSSKITGER
jgi:fructoselysine-6-P-deglycase FrlB-like protein